MKMCMSVTKSTENFHWSHDGAL